MDNNASPKITSHTISKGSAWVFGDNINTDIIIPFRFKSRTNDPYEMAKYAMYGFDPEFHNKISNGDVIVAGRILGGGSSREQAPVVLRYAGISAVIAETMPKSKKHIVGIKLGKFCTYILQGCFYHWITCA
jgi:3-isopropylmalate dehydratase small subunit